jgi:hypothetical protein
MTPKQKAEELINKMYYTQSSPTNWMVAKQCALIAVDEVMERTLWDKGEQRFWKEVKQEIENL